MRIVNRKRFVFSCIFFTCVLLIFGRLVFFLTKSMSSKSCITPLAASNKIQQSKNQILIVLDAGHGGIDRGTSFKGLNEKDLTLKIVKNMKEILKNKGYKVLLTRNEDKLIPLQEIGNMVNASHADVFVSIHINSIPDPNFSGITSLYYDVNGFQKNKRMELAETLQNESTKSDKWNSKGIKRQNVAILRYSKVPCALIECGFITNVDDRKKLKDEQVIKRLSENLCSGVMKYLDKNN